MRESGVAAIVPLEEIRFGIDGLIVRAFEGGEGAPIVLLHGGGTDFSELSWGPTGRELASSHRVLMPDWPGYGGSKPFRSRCTQQALVEQVGRLLDHWKLERATLMGVSMGGGAALGYALDHADRVERLVLVGSHGLATRAPCHFLAWLFTHTPGCMELAWSLIRTNRWMAHQTLVNIVADPSALSGDLETSFLESLRSKTATRAFTQWQRSEIRWRGLRSCYLDRLSDLRVPTLLVHGDSDRLIPVAAAQEAAKRIPQAELAVLPGCGHWAQREQPALFMSALTPFLD